MRGGLKLQLSLRQQLGQPRGRCIEQLVRPGQDTDDTLTRVT
jgi:hypothetical protein